MDWNKRSDNSPDSIYEAFLSFSKSDSTTKEKIKNTEDMEGRRIRLKQPNSQTRESYIDHLDEFLDEKEHNIDSFMSSANNLEKSIRSLSINEDSKAITMKLSRLLTVLNSKIQTLTDGNFSRTQNWVMKNQAGNLSTPFNLSVSTDLDKLEVMSVNSASTSNDISSYNLDKNSVYCQYCNELVADLLQLVNHLFNDCQRFKNKNFRDPRRFSMSYFQLLVNEMIKCNICNINTLRDLKGKIYHENSHHHKKNLRRNKGNEDFITKQFIFCNCCKVLIPDSFIQYRSHIENKEHVDNKNSQFTFFDLAGKGFQMVISKKNIIKCLECSRVEFRFDMDKIRDHVGSDFHKGNLKRNSGISLIYCEICDENFQFFELESHTNSNVHLNFLKMKTSAIETSMRYQYCLFCDDQFENLKDMAYHQEAVCGEVRKIRRSLGPFL